MDTDNIKVLVNEKLDNIIPDFTNNGECSKCGHCCGRFLPLSPDEINKIKKYKLSQKLERLKKEQKELERKGKIEESIKLAVELSKVSKILKNQNIISNHDGRWDE